MSKDATRRRPLMSAAIRYLGALPKDATELQRLRWIRRVGLKIALPSLPVVVLAVLEIDQTWCYVVFAIWVLAWLTSLARLSRDIRRCS